MCIHLFYTNSHLKQFCFFLSVSIVSNNPYPVHLYLLFFFSQNFFSCLLSNLFSSISLSFSLSPSLSLSPFSLSLCLSLTISVSLARSLSFSICPFLSPSHSVFPVLSLPLRKSPSKPYSLYIFACSPSRSLSLSRSLSIYPSLYIYLSIYLTLSLSHSFSCPIPLFPHSLYLSFSLSNSLYPPPPLSHSVFLLLFLSH